MRKIKKILCLILIITSIFTMNIGTAFADDNQSEIEINSESAQMLVKLAMSIVSSNYKFDITTEELYKNTLFEIIKKYPEVWETAFEGIFNNLPKRNLKALLRTSKAKFAELVSELWNFPRVL